MSRYQLRFSQQAQKDIERLTPKLRIKLKSLLVEVIAENPYEGKKLLGDLAGNYSYRLTFKDRVIYSVDEERRINVLALITAIDHPLFFEERPL